LAWHSAQIHATTHPHARYGHSLHAHGDAWHTWPGTGLAQDTGGSGVLIVHLLHHPLLHVGHWSHRQALPLHPHRGSERPFTQKGINLEATLDPSTGHQWGLKRIKFLNVPLVFTRKCAALLRTPSFGSCWPESTEPLSGGKGSCGVVIECTIAICLVAKSFGSAAAKRRDSA
jgi:hypothetical protein